jgi:Mg2+/Co2+ transporter CorB
MDPEPSFAYTLDTDLMFGFIGIFVLLLCSALVSGAEVALFSLSQQDIESTRPCVKGKIIADLIDRPKKSGALLVANNFINIGVVICFHLLVKIYFLYHFTGVKIHCRSNPSFFTFVVW